MSPVQFGGFRSFPTLADDPSFAFPMGATTLEELAENALGLLRDPEAMKKLQELLKSLGHDVDPTGEADDKTIDAMRGSGDLDLDLLAKVMLLLMLSQGSKGAPGGGGGGPAGGGGGGRAGGGDGFQRGGGGLAAPGLNPTAPRFDAGPRGVPSAADLVGPGDPSRGITPDTLRQIVPGMSEQRAQELVPHLNRAMDEAGITTARDQAAFIAQLAHESGGFRHMEEIASGAAYEGRRDLGNNQPGDGVRFKGRGFIQLTGRANYRAAGRALGLDLENNPELAARPEVASRVAAWYWQSRNISAAANAGDFTRVTRLVNGGTNGLADRQQYYNRALQALA